MISVRLVQVVLSDGTRIVGITSATLSDAELERVSDRVEATFSNVMEVPKSVPLGNILQRLESAKTGAWQ